MKTLTFFLDLDGVINNYASLSYNIHIDQRCVAELNRIMLSLIDKYEVQIIISSAWRVGRDVETIRYALWRSGMTQAGLIVGKTSTEHKGHRGEQIQEWLDNNETDLYIIIDDESFDIYPYQKTNMIKTHMQSGINKQHYNQVHNLLKELEQ